MRLRVKQSAVQTVTCTAASFVAIKKCDLHCVSRSVIVLSNTRETFANVAQIKRYLSVASNTSIFNTGFCFLDKVVEVVLVLCKHVFGDLGSDGIRR